MKWLPTLFITLCFSVGCGSTEHQVVHSNGQSVSDGFVASEDDPSTDKVISFSFIDKETPIPGDVIVNSKCKEEDKICFKKVVYDVRGLDRKISSRMSRDKPKQTLRFSVDSLGSQNYCFRVVMFTDIDDFEIHTENPFNEPENGHLQDPKDDIWKLSHCEVRKGDQTAKCGFWRQRKLSPFTEVIEGQVVRKYFANLDQVYFSPQERDFGNKKQETFYYAIEGVKKVQNGRAMVCPTASVNNPLLPQKMSGDPRMRMVR